MSRLYYNGLNNSNNRELIIVQCREYLTKLYSSKYSISSIQAHAQAISFLENIGEKFIDLSDSEKIEVAEQLTSLGAIIELED